MLTLLYDETCSLCLRAAAWLIEQPSLVPLELLPSGSEAARARYGSIPWRGKELVVVSDVGDVWVGPEAFIVVLWALSEWRDWSYFLGRPLMAPLARRFFLGLSASRGRVSAFLGPVACTERVCATPHAYR